MSVCFPRVANRPLTYILVYRDVEHIEPLTKAEVLDFYNKYFLPGSPHRSKFSVHLIAQASPEDIAAKMNPSEQREKLAEEIDTVLQQMLQGAPPMDRAGLVAEFEKVDISTGDIPTILNALGAYLAANGMPEEVLETVHAQGVQFLPQLLPAAGIVAPVPEVTTTNGVNGHAETNGAANGLKQNKLVKVEDVRAFKASLPLTAGPRPVADLSEFEELEPKL